MALPCPDIIIGSENSAQGQLFNEALIVTDTDFTSHEDCDVFASYFYQVTDANTNISEFPLLFSNLDAIVDTIWKPEEVQGLNLMFQAIINWLKSIGLDVDTNVWGQYLPSGESIRLFAELSVSLILLLVFIFAIRGFYSAGLFKFPQIFKFKQDELQSKNGNFLPPASIDELPLRQQLAVLLQRSILILKKYHVIPVSTCYTNHELINYIDVSKSQAASLLGRQVKLTEPVIYGNRPATQEVLFESQQICDDISRFNNE